MKRTIAILMTAAMLLLLLCGCAGGEGGNTGTNNSDSVFAGNSDQTYYMITFYPSLSLWAPCWQGFQDAAEQLGVKAELAGPSSLVAAEEVAVVEQAATMGATAICVSPIEPVSFIDVINDTIEGGTPVMCFDSDCPESNRLCYIGTSNYAAGEAGAEELAKQIGGSGDVLLFTMVGQLNHQERLRGAQEYLAANYPDIHVVQVLSAEQTTDAAAAAVDAALQANPNVKGIFSTVATGTLGAAQVIKESGYKMANVGFDTDPSVLACIEEGTATATISQNYYVMGYTMLMEMYIYCNNLSNPYENWKENDIPCIPSNTDTGIAVVTPENLDVFYNKEA